MYRKKAYEIPEAGRTAKGTALVNLLALEPEETISAVIPIREYEEGKFLLMCTKAGVIKKTDLMEYKNAPSGGKIAIRLDEGDELIQVSLTDGTNDIFIGSHLGKMIRFNEKDVRMMGRVSRGVRGMNLEDGDYVVGMSLACENGKMLVVSEKGYGKKTELSEYKCQTRGGKGTTSYRISEDTGAIAGVQIVTPEDDAILITSEGIIIRMDTEEISTYGRVTKGVRLMRMGADTQVMTVAVVKKEEESSEETEPVTEEQTEE
jgi:DNA gyrase subunit A